MARGEPGGNSHLWPRFSPWMEYALGCGRFLPLGRVRSGFWPLEETGVCSALHPHLPGRTPAG